MRGSKLTIWVLGILGVISLFHGCSVHNTCIKKENGIQTSNENLAAVISSKDNILAGKSQVVQKYAQTTLEAMKTIAQSHNGTPQQVMVIIKEQNPNINDDVFEELSQAVESNFKDIESANRMLVDKVEKYKNYYQTFPNSWFAKVQGFPRIDIEKLGTAVITGNARQEIETRKSKEVDLFGDKKE